VHLRCAPLQGKLVYLPEEVCTWKTV